MSIKLNTNDSFTQPHGADLGSGPAIVTHKPDLGTAGGVGGLGGGSHGLSAPVAHFGTRILSNLLGQVSSTPGGPGAGGIGGHGGHGGYGGMSGGVHAGGSLSGMISLGSQLEAAYNADPSGVVQKLQQSPAAAKQLNQLADRLEKSLPFLPAGSLDNINHLIDFSRQLACAMSTGPKTPILPPVDYY